MHAIFTEQLIVPRRRAIREILERAEQRGEVRPGLDSEVVTDLIAGPMIYRVLVGGMAMEELPAHAAILMTALDGLRSR